MELNSYEFKIHFNVKRKKDKPLTIA